MRMPSNGYTVVEALMVLAISGALFASVTTLISGKQAETEFNTGVRDFENKIQDVLNDVATGYYSSTGDTTCSGSAGNYTIGTGGTQGTNNQCTFVGKAIQFRPSSANNTESTVNVYTIIGQREYNDSGTIREPKNIQEAGPGLPQADGLLSDSFTLNSGMIIRDVQIDSDTSVGGFAILDSFGQTNVTGGGVVAGSSSNGLARLGDLGFDAAYSVVSDNVKNLSSDSSLNQPVRICIGDPGNGRRAAIVLNGRGTEILYGTDSIDAGCPTA